MHEIIFNIMSRKMPHIKKQLKYKQEISRNYVLKVFFIFFYFISCHTAIFSCGIFNDAGMLHVFHVPLMTLNKDIIRREDSRRKY